MRTNTFHFGRFPIDVFKFPLERKLRVEGEELSSSEFTEDWVKMAEMARSVFNPVSRREGIGEVICSAGFREISDSGGGGGSPDYL